MIFEGWDAVATHMNGLADASSSTYLTPGQRASVREIARRLATSGVILADDVGMGKTRIAALVARAVVAARGRVALLLPPGLGHQWEEELTVDKAKACSPLLRGLSGYFSKELKAEARDDWLAESIVVLSHRFADWRIKQSSNRWRTMLFPAVFGLWLEHKNGRQPRDFREMAKVDGWEWVKPKATSIVEAAKQHEASGEALVRVLGDLLWKPSELRRPDGYQMGGEYRGPFEKVVGLGLGKFDLIIIDEAHKGRDAKSTVSKLIELLHVSNDCRRLCLTATPIDIDTSNWGSALTRIGLEELRVRDIEQTIAAYDRAAQSLQFEWHSEASRQKYRDVAQAFQAALEPYLLRRGKSEDQAVRLFREHTQGLGLAYRHIQPLRITMDTLKPAWKEIVCAAEALSWASRGDEDQTSKRARLTIGNGHSLAYLIDSLPNTARLDNVEMPNNSDSAVSGEATQDTPPGAKVSYADLKRKERCAYWKQVIYGHMAKMPDGIHEHPAVLAVVEEAERYNALGEKVLIFGRFTQPMRAITRLLNARRMLRGLAAQQAWPHSEVLEDHAKDDADMGRAIRAAHRQLCEAGISCPPLDTLKTVLQDAYNVTVEQEEKRREQILAALFDAPPPEGRVGDALRELKKRGNESTQRKISRLLSETLGQQATAPRQRLSEQVLDVFSELVSALTDTDDTGDAGIDDAGEKEEQAQSALSQIADNVPQSNSAFARLMIGDTRMSARRLLQLAFNRRACWPDVLVTQSIVGREGLNLHKACRVVICVHLEWNPGVVEQQIGRVDRLGSRWQEVLEEAIHNATTPQELPRIEVRPVIFEGTYDEHNWLVLKKRWESLRAQLHGEVVLSDEASGDPAAQKVRAELLAHVPNFSPLKRDVKNFFLGAARGVNWRRSE